MAERLKALKDGTKVGLYYWFNDGGKIITERIKKTAENFGTDMEYDKYFLFGFFSAYSPALVPLLVILPVGYITNKIEKMVISFQKYRHQ